MNCSETKRLIVLLESELDLREREILLKHLKQCDGCRACWDEITAQQELLQEALRPDRAPDLADRVIERLRRRND